MTTNRFRTAGAGGSGEVPAPAGPMDAIFNLEDVAQYLRCSTDEARAFLAEHVVVGVEFPSGPRYLRGDVHAAFVSKLQATRVKLAEVSKADEIQANWMVWLNKVQGVLTPSEQDGWVKFARFLVSRRISPMEFFRRAAEDRQNLVRMSGVDFRLRDDYGNAHIGLDGAKGSGISPAVGLTRSVPSATKPGSKPFGG